MKSTGKRARLTGRQSLVEFSHTLVTLYLLPEVNLRLRPKLLKDLKVGSRIVSHQFDMGDWEADDQIQIEWRAVYVWTVTEAAKARFAGN